MGKRRAVLATTVTLTNPQMNRLFLVNQKHTASISGINDFDEQTLFSESYVVYLMADFKSIYFYNLIFFFSLQILLQKY